VGTTLSRNMLNVVRFRLNSLHYLAIVYKQQWTYYIDPTHFNLLTRDQVIMVRVLLTLKNDEMLALWSHLIGWTLDQLSGALDTPPVPPWYHVITTLSQMATRLTHLFLVSCAHRASLLLP